MFMPVIFACGPAITDHEYCAPALAPVVQGYARFHPIGYELIFENGAFVDVAAVAEARRHGRIWVNSLKPEMAGGVSDATAVADPDGVWGKLIGQGVTMIQTDHPRELLAYLRRRGLHE
jgi:glycerophosphoryl diester phosphodiesterase